MESGKLVRTIISVSCRTLVFVLMALLLFFASKSAFAFGEKVFDETTMASGDNVSNIDFVVRNNASVYDVAKDLEAAGLIDDAKVFWTRARVSDYYGKFIPGVYVLNTGMTYSDIMAVISTEPETEAEEETEETTEKTTSSQETTSSEETTTVAMG